MQQAKCCDVLGACSDDGQCSAEFKATHRCLVENGASRRSQCKQNLDGGAGRRSSTACARSAATAAGSPRLRSRSCGDALRLADLRPVHHGCVLQNQCMLQEPAVPALPSECITNRCPKTTGASLSNILQFPAGARRVRRRPAPPRRLPERSRSRAPSIGPMPRPLSRWFATPKPGCRGEPDRAVPRGRRLPGAKSGCGPRCDRPHHAAGAYPEDDAGAGAGGRRGRGLRSRNLQIG